MRQALSLPAEVRGRLRAGAGSASVVRLTKLDRLLVIILAFPVFGTFFPLSSYLSSGINGSSGAEAGRDTTIVVALILLTILWLFARRLPASVLALQRSWILFVFVFWAMFTSRWVEIPGLSFNRSGRMLIFVLYGIYMVEFVEPRRRAKIIFYALALSLSLSLLSIIAVPSLSRSLDGRGIFGTWRGGMGHKNSLGTLAGIAFLYSGILLKAGHMPRKLCAALAFLSFVLLLLANSVTALLATLAISGLMAYLFFVVPLMKDRLVALMLGALLATIMILLVNSMGQILEVFGRDGGLTGRAEVWQFAHLMIEQKPFWGWGHGAWSMPVFSKLVLATLRWACPHAHSFWIDLRLQLGVPGLGIATLIAVTLVLRMSRLILTRPIEQIAFPLAILIFLGFRSYSETIMLDVAVGDTFWVAILAASLSSLARERPNRRGGASQRFMETPKRFGAVPDVGAPLHGAGIGRPFP